MTTRHIGVLTAVSAASAALLLAGTARVSTGRTRATQPTAWTLEPLFSAGAAADGNELQRVRSLQWLTDGRLLVADVGARSILVFAADGLRQGSLGRDGAGPGEYRAPNSLALLGDTVAVLDHGNVRIGFFGPRGDWVGSVPVSPITGSEVRLMRLPGRQFYAWGTRKGERTIEMAYVRFDTRGPHDTVARRVRPAAPDEVVMCNGTDGGLHFFSTPFTDRSLDYPGPNGTLLVAQASSNLVAQVNARGDTVTRFAVTAARVPIGDAEWDSVTADLRSYLAKDKGAKCTRESLARPSVKPVIRAFFWDDRGRLWVERYTRTGFSFDVFSARGVLLASLDAPAREASVEPSVVGDRLALLTTDVDGAHVVRAYRIRAR